MTDRFLFTNSQAHLRCQKSHRCQEFPGIFLGNSEFIHVLLHELLIVKSLHDQSQNTQIFCLQISNFTNQHKFHSKWLFDIAMLSACTLTHDIAVTRSDITVTSQRRCNITSLNGKNRLPSSVNFLRTCTHFTRYSAVRQTTHPPRYVNAQTNLASLLYII